MRTETGRPTAAHTGRATAVHHPLRVVGLLGLTLHLVLVGWLVLRPLPVAWVYDANLTPLASLHSSSLGQVLGELLLPAPLGLLLPLAGGRLRAPWLLSFLRTTGASALLATALEFLSSWAPGHVLNVDHILLAVVGVGITHLALVPAGRSLLLRRATAPRATAPRSTASRATASRPTVSARVQAPAAAPTAAPTSAPAVYAEPVAGRGH
ncbi:VanZ family protein [Streptomyces sp. BE303]|uniref:VanZ family protein n=1 Tax=Streptomyces sp. BE303 TaxID=3002528 RepID=UPI002E764F9C|nr:VanZ family protein [Streptomyces sp. BE303]MED7952220.1 VanZ family protein [Streptomyces sp. BE303]